jgi:hypothetical protein
MLNCGESVREFQMSIKYTYSISQDFLNGKVDSTKLTYEIGESNITIALDYINTSGDDCDIWFKIEISNDEKIILNGIVINHDGEQISEIENPKSEDGKIFVAPNMFPLGVITNFCGVSDDVENGIIGGGDMFIVSSIQQGETEKIFGFVDWSYLAGGHVMFSGATVGDWVSFLTYCPATIGTYVEGYGMFNKYPVGVGVNIFIPAAGDGYWNLDLDEKENANVNFSKVKPVPADGIGFFDWNENTEEITINYNGKGGYHLFDVIMPLNEFVSKVPLLGNHTLPLIVPAVKPIKILPHWKNKITLYNSSNKSLNLTALFYKAKYVKM